MDVFAIGNCDHAAESISGEARFPPGVTKTISDNVKIENFHNRTSKYFIKNGGNSVFNLEENVAILHIC